MAFGRFSNGKSTKSAASGKHRGAASDPVAVAVAEDEPDHELESYLAALAPETDAETTDTGRRFGDAQVYQLRLNLIMADQIKQLAAERDSAPLSLIQEWVLDRLRWESEKADTERQRVERARWDPRGY